VADRISMEYVSSIMRGMLSRRLHHLGHDGVAQQGAWTHIYVAYRCWVLAFNTQAYRLPTPTQESRQLTSRPVHAMSRLLMLFCYVGQYCLSPSAPGVIDAQVPGTHCTYRSLAAHEAHSRPCPVQRTL
jgi:hypothetical protein